MSNTDKKEKTLEIKQSTLYMIFGTMLVLVAAIITLVFISFNKTNTTTVTIKKLSAGKQNEASEKIQAAMKNLRTKSILFSLEDGNQSDLTLLYNTHGEVVAESVETGYKTFYLNNHKTINFSESIGYGEDSEIISILERVANIRDENKFPIYRLADIELEKVKNDSSSTSASSSTSSTSSNNTTDNKEDKITVTSYAVDVRGWDNVKKIYSYVSDEFAGLMIENLKASVKALAESSEDSSITEDSIINLRFVYKLNGEQLYGAECYIYFGDTEGDKVDSADLIHNWAFQDYLEIYDWQLENRWYELDWENLENWESTSELEELFKTQYESILAMMDQFALDNGMAVTSDDSNNANGNTSSSGDASSTNNTGDTSAISSNSGDTSNTSGSSSDTSTASNENNIVSNESANSSDLTITGDVSSVENNG